MSAPPDLRWFLWRETSAARWEYAEAGDLLYRRVTSPGAVVLAVRSKPPRFRADRPGEAREPVSRWAPVTAPPVAVTC